MFLISHSALFTFSEENINSNSKVSFFLISKYQRKRPGAGKPFTKKKWENVQAYPSTGEHSSMNNVITYRKENPFFSNKKEKENEKRSLKRKCNGLSAYS